MLDPTTLFRWEPHVDQRTVHADTLVVTLGSYIDAGHTQRQLDDHLLQRLPNRLLGTFDADQLYDYTTRRPQIVFDRNRFDDFRGPRLALHLLTDHDGRDFLLLNGPEPSLQWERAAAAVVYLADQLGVAHTLVVSTMPAPAPHTRPVFISRYASDPTLVAGEPAVLGTFNIAAAFAGLLTLRLGESGHEVVGLLAHVPHYLAEADFPPAASAMVKALRDRTHLALPTDGFELSSALAAKQIDAQIAQSEELTEMVRTLEEQYDRFVEQVRLNPSHEGQLPSADELGARFEDFLANLGDEGTDQAPPPDSDT